MIFSRALTINRVEHQQPQHFICALVIITVNKTPQSLAVVSQVQSWMDRVKKQKRTKTKNKTSFTTIGRTPAVRHDCEESTAAADANDGDAFDWTAVPIFAQLPQI